VCSSDLLLVDAVADMQDAIRTCSPEFAEVFVSRDDYEIVDEAEEKQ
jgi:hypothetical protein